MINFDHVAKENVKEHDSKRPKIFDHPYRMLIIGGSGTGKRNSSLYLINYQPDGDKIDLYAKDPYEEKQFLINKWENTGFKPFNDPKAFIEYSNDTDDIYKNIK